MFFVPLKKSNTVTKEMYAILGAEGNKRKRYLMVVVKYRIGIKVAES